MEPSSTSNLGAVFAYFRWADELSGRVRDLPSDDDVLAALFLRTWLGALGAAAEGWNALGLKHPIVTRLLAQTVPRIDRVGERAFADLLRAARRDVFRFTAADNPPGVKSFLRTPGAIEWAHDLHVALRAFFEQGVKQRG